MTSEPTAAPAADYVDSYYRRTLADTTTWPRLDAAIEAEVCVIGGGLAGLNTALGLAERGRSVALLEAHRVGWGASGRNGGFVSTGFALSATALANRVGREHARALYRLTQEALALIRRRIDRHAFDCGPIAPGIVIARWRGGSGDLRPYVDFMRDEMGAAYEHWPADRLAELYRSDRYADAAFDADGLHLNALNFTRGIAAMATAAGARLHEASPVAAVDRAGDGFRVRTSHGNVRADQVVCCMSGYIGRRPRRLAELMRRDLVKVYPQLTAARPAVAWDGLMGYARHKMPQIGRLRSGLWYCMGFGGKGMCATTMGGELIATAIADGDERWRLFEPFALGYAGGPLAPLIAGTVYAWYKLRDSARV